MKQIKEFAKELVYKRKDVKLWLDGNVAFSQYDGELGWLLKDCHVKDGALCTYSYENNGLCCRKTINYADGKCRINAYGDSFTQCHQVSDGEITLC